MRLAIISIVPSPYQRDLFAEMAVIFSEKTHHFAVFYTEDAAPDSPWPQAQLADYEKIMHGWCLGKGRVRCHYNTIPAQIFCDFDLIIINTSLTDLTTQILMRKLNFLGKKWIFFGEIIRQSNKPILQWLKNKLQKPLQNASAIIAIGEEAKLGYEKITAQRVPVENVSYYCAIDSFFAGKLPILPARFEQKSSKKQLFADDALNLLFCGQMIARKGIDVLLAAFVELVSKNPSANLILHLAGRDDELEKFLAELPAEFRAKIVNLGFIAPDELPAIFRRADVFVLPSRHDGWGVVINQAIATGLPIIASTAVLAAKELARENGILVTPGDSAELTAALEKILDDETRLAMAQNSAQIRHQLSPSIGAKKIFDIANKIHQS